MRLIEVAELKDHIEDRDALLKQRRCLLRAVELLDVALRQSGGAEESMAHRARRDRLHDMRLIVQDGVDERIAHHKLVPHQPLDKRISVLEGRELPRRPFQPEGLPRRWREWCFSVEAIA